MTITKTWMITMTDKTPKQVYKVWMDVPHDFDPDIQDIPVELHEFNDDFINLERVRELIGDNCRIAQNLPGTEYTMWVCEESKLKEGMENRGNPFGTQAWQDSAAHHMGWEWLTAHYGGFVWNHDLIIGKAIEILNGQWEDEGSEFEYIVDGKAMSKEDYENIE